MWAGVGTWSTAHAPSGRLAHRLASSRLGGVQRSERGAPLTYRSLATYFRTDSLCTICLHCHTHYDYDYIAYLGGLRRGEGRTAHSRHVGARHLAELLLQQRVAHAHAQLALRTRIVDLGWGWS